MRAYDREKYVDEQNDRHVGSKRNRIRIPKSNIPVVEGFSPYALTSSAKGRGFKVCQREGKHDLIRARPRWGVGFPFFVWCRRCGDLVNVRRSAADRDN